MKIKSIFFVFLFLVGLLPALAQEQGQTDPDIQILDDNEENLNLLNSNMTKQDLVNSNLSTPQSNEVFIRQIGLNNTIFTKVVSSDAKVNLQQNGTDNNIYMEANAPSIRENILQDGNNNYAFDSYSSTNLPVKLDLVQQGDNLSFERSGVNSKTNEMKVTQTEAAPSIIIRSF